MTRFRRSVGLIAGICLCLAYEAHSQTPSPAPGATSEKTVMTMTARGTFDVKVTPESPGDKPEDAAIGRMTLDKQFHGDLEATSKGQMLSAGTAVKGSAGYVAMEFVNGALNGHAGTFVLQHIGTMTRGEPHLSITVVPDSGTGQLAGLSGKMSIIIAEGKHSYELEYTLGAPR